MPYQPIAAAPNRKNRFTVGVETFYDRYEEPDTFPDLGVNAYYGALDVGWEHYFNPKWYSNLETRFSYGKADYKSNSGKVNNITDYELEGRFTGGYDMPMGAGKHFKTYAGLGMRQYLDYFKKDSVPGTYDRRIFQVYAPIGVTYEFSSGGWTFAPNFELNPLIYGYVQSRLQTIPGLETASNLQRDNGGMGYRAEFMMSRLSSDGRGWQFGPFIRYWDIEDSNVDLNASGAWVEPRNTRLQAGAKLKYLF